MLFLFALALSNKKEEKNKIKLVWGLPEFFPFANGTFPNVTLWRSPWVKFNSKFNQTWDPFNATVHRLNDTRAPYWKTSPYYYNGNSMWNGTQTLKCVAYTNSSNGTNCSFIYGGPYFNSSFDDNVPKCFQPLMKSYGLSGFPYATQDRSEMCPSIEHSCCSDKDFAESYQLWVESGMKTNAENKLEYYQETYNEYIESLGKASGIVKAVSARIHDINNCKILANTIDEYDVLTINGKVMDFVKVHFAYLKTNFNSFYCTICDGENHDYLDFAKRKLVLNHNSCYNIVKNSLFFLLYFHNHYVKLNNLIVDFTTYCEPDGDFEKIHLNEAMFKLDDDTIEAEKLKKCKEHFGSSDWFKHCSFICEEYSMTTVDEFFLPNFEKLGSISSLINGNVEIIEKELEALHHEFLENGGATSATKVAHHRMLEESINNKKHGRKLATEAIDTSHMFLKGLAVDKIDHVFIMGSIGQTVELHELKPIFREKGIDLKEIQNNSFMTKIKFEDDLDNLALRKKFDGDNLAIHKAVISRYLNSSFIPTLFLNMFVLGLFVVNGL